MSYCGQIARDESPGSRSSAGHSAFAGTDGGIRLPAGDLGGNQAPCRSASFHCTACLGFVSMAAGLRKGLAGPDIDDAPSTACTAPGGVTASGRSSGPGTDLLYFA